MKIRINNVEYDCVEGSLLTRNFNETLDNANVRISHLEELIEIEPFDSVEILIDNEIIYMLVDSYECIEEGLDPIYYTYEISLFSPTKQLENIILPNIAITPNSENRSIYYYLEQYLREYGNVSWSLSQDGELARFANIPCPEMQWNTPTLREVFDDLMMIDDCICVFKGTSAISCLDLTTRGSEITDYNYIRRSRSSQDYVSDIKMNLQNAMEDGSQIMTERITFTSDNSVITSENFVLKTQFPIKNIKHLYMNVCAGLDIDVSPSRWKYLRGDLMTILARPLVAEYSEYLTKEIIYKPAFQQLQVGLDAYRYQNFCLYFQRYSNVIQGFSEIQPTSYSNAANRTQILEHIIALALNEGYSFDSLASFSSTYFEIEYETTHESVFSASKSKLPKHKRMIMDNQTNSFVNTKAQASLEYQKANRLGNEQLLINQRTDNLNNAIKLAQTYQDSVIYQTQYQIYSDHVEVNALATKNYILQNYFTGIKSHIRSWVNAKDEALIRHELIKDRYVFSYENNNEDNSLFLTPLNFTAVNNINLCSCKIDNTLPSSASGYNMHVLSRVLGNSIVLTIGFNDNAIFLRSIAYGEITSGDFDATAGSASALRIDDNFVSNYGGIPTKNYFYVDGNYEFFELDLKYYHTDFPQDNGTFTVGQGSLGATHLTEIYQGNVEAYDFQVREILRKTIQRHKDNKEIFKLSYQIEFGVDDIENIYIGNKFFERQQIINATPLSNNYRVYTSDKLKSYIPENAINKTQFNLVVGTNSITCEVDALPTDYVYICDTERNVIVAFKYKQDTIYLNKE